MDRRFPDRGRHRLLVAFVAAAMVSLVLYAFAGVLLPLGLGCLEGWCVTSFKEVMAIILYFFLMVTVGTIPVMLAAALLAYPAYLLLKALDALRAVWIVFLSFIIGSFTSVLFYSTMSIREFTANTDDFLLSVLAGICAAIGGLVFCRMTIWKSGSGS